MKKIIAIILLVAGFFSNAQQQELIDNTWYLKKLVFNDMEYLAPSNEEISEVPFYHFETIGNVQIFKTKVCQEVRTGGTITDSHLYFDTSAYEPNCDIQENTDFQFLYFDNFLWAGVLNSVEYPYEITEENGHLNLIINPNTDFTAYYTNEVLSSNEVHNLNHNPFLITFQNDNLIIQSNSAKAKSVAIFDLSGKLVLNSNILNNKLNTKGLPNGIYLIQLTDEKGNLFSKKVRKS